MKTTSSKSAANPNTTAYWPNKSVTAAVLRLQTLLTITAEGQCLCAVNLSASAKHPTHGSERGCRVWDLIVTYLVPAAIVLVFILPLLKYLASRTGPLRPNLRSLDDEADKAGAAGSEEEEHNIKAIFEEFRQKENLQ